LEKALTGIPAATAALPHLSLVILRDWITAMQSPPSIGRCLSLAQKYGWRRSFRFGGARLLGLAAIFIPLQLMAAEPPKIDHIETFLSDQVTVHFDTEANRTYELQSRAATNSAWTNLFVAPRLPFPNHYIVVDSATNRARLYRLRVTP